MGKKLPVVKLLVREGIMPLEIDGHGDVVGRGDGGDLAPIEQLIRIGELRQADECQL